MENQIVKINPAEYGLEEIKATEIANQFKPMLDKMVELESEFNEVLKLPIEEFETSRKAKELRLKYVKVRTGTADIHKKQKEFYLSGGRFVDGWKNAQIFASQGIEKKLEDIEKYAENLEKERVAKLQIERETELTPFGIENISSLNLGSMSDDIWSNFLTGTKTNFEAKIAAEKKAEEDRIAQEKAEAEERERIRFENEKLKAEAIEKEKQLEIERAKADAERKLAEEKAAKLKAESDAKLKAEQEAKAKLEAELKAKADAEEKIKKDLEIRAEQERLAAIEAAKAPDKEKLKTWINSIMIGLTPDLGGDGHKLAVKIHEQFSKFQDWAKKEIEKL